MTQLLKTPNVRKTELPYRPFKFPIKAAKPLPNPTPLPELTFTNTVDRRCSLRRFVRGLNDIELSRLLWVTQRTISSYTEPSGYIWEHRGSPSAGGRHPIHLFIINRTRTKAGVHLYIPQNHALREMKLPETKVKALMAHSDAVVNSVSATLIIFVAEHNRTASKYANAESLIWRDSGAVLAMMNLASSAFGFASCGLGVDGEPHISRMFGMARLVYGVGGVVVGHAQKASHQSVQI